MYESLSYVSVFAGAALIIIIGFISTILLEKKEIPDPLPLILIGVLLGPILGYLPADKLSVLLPIFSNLALLVVMFEAGLNLNIYDVVKTIGKAYTVSISYYVLSILVTVLISHLFLGMSIVDSLILGSILGGVSGPIVIPVIERFVKDSQVKSILFLDSTFSDVFVIILTLAFLQIRMLNSFDFWQALGNVVSRFAIGMFYGVIFGMIWIKILRYLRSERYTYMLTLAFLLLLYSLTELTGGSGAFASLTVGIILSNAREILEMLKLGYTYRLRGIIVYLHEEITFFIRTFFFVFLGAMFSFKNLNFAILLAALVISMLFILMRYLVLKPFVKNAEARAKLSLVVGRGLGAAVVATMIAQQGVINNEIVLQLVTLVILLTNSLFFIFLPIIKSHERETRENI